MLLSALVRLSELSHGMYEWLCLVIYGHVLAPHTQTSHQTALLFPNNRSVAISIKNSQKIIAL